MEKEELLIEAKIRFSIGTKFREPNDSRIYTVKAFDNTNVNSWNSNRYIIVWVEGITGCGKYLYNDGVWAETITDNYEIY